MRPLRYLLLLTASLADPDSVKYRRFLDRLLEVYRAACQLQRDQRFSDAGRAAKVDILNDELCELCGDPLMDETESATELEGDYCNLIEVPQ